MAIPEEFPDFTHFWIGEGKTPHYPVEVYALLDGPSVAGAYCFVMHRGFATTMDITCELHLRKPIPRLDIAPMTSMYWYSESVKAKAADWRPEIHDSDGPRDLGRHRRAPLAAADQPADAADLELPRRDAERLRPDAARPRL